MRYFNNFAVVSVVAILLTGCAQGENPDALMKQSVAAMNELADAMEKVDSAKIRASIDKLKNCRKNLEAIKLTEEQKKELEKKYHADFTAASARMAGAVLNASMSGKLSPDVMKEISGLGKK